ncbi:hypothetical protein C8Q79DRAFT_1001564 [Trametes meyenii]|nr:hypothetical protein C8Q79DRAFT_1001564 [Trametes meyenii]
MPTSIRTGKPLIPEWLTESPITAEDLRCTTPASTIFRMSFGVGARLHPRESIAGSILDDDDDEDPEEDDDDDEEEEDSDESSFLWDDGVSDDDSDTIEESDTSSAPSPVPSKSSPLSGPSAPTPHSRTPSSSTPAATRPFDIRSPWFMQIDPSCLAALDDQLLQAPQDAFADLCYSHAVRTSDARASPVPGGYSWRRLSRLLSACPDLTLAVRDFAEGERGRESESESDTDSEPLASPEQSAPVQNWACKVYQPDVEHHHAESPYRPYASQTLISKPLPALPPHSYSSSPPASPPPCSPPPMYSPTPTVTQAQLALLFTNTPSRPGESVHFSPGQETAKVKGRGRRGTLRVSTATAATNSNSSSASPWSAGSARPNILQRGLAGIRAGLSH